MCIRVRDLYDAGLRTLQVDDCTWGVLVDDNFLTAWGDVYKRQDTTLPYKDEEEQKMFDYGPRPRRRKEAEPIHDQNDSPFF